MTRSEFLEAVRVLGFRETNGYLWGKLVRRAPGLRVDYDGDRPKAIVAGNAKDRSVAIGFLLEPTEIAADFHFSAAILGDEGADEYVHVLEEGPYFDHVFLNCHDEGLSTVEDLVDADDFDPSTLSAVFSEDAYEDVDKKTRLEWQPFFQRPIARSLTEMLGMLEAD